MQLHAHSFKRGMCEWASLAYQLIEFSLRTSIVRFINFFLSLYLRLVIAFILIYVEYNEIGLLKIQTRKYRK